MAGLGLMDAVKGYQQGVAWKQDQDQYALQQKRQKAIDEANAAATGVIEKSKAEWAMNGAQGTYAPNDMTMFRAAEARGLALAKAGDWENFMRNEAAVAPQRMRVRSTAMQRYEQDGDVEALARTVYPTIFDGKEIAGVERIEGADAVGKFAAVPTKLKFKLSDGTEHALTPDEIVKVVKSSLVDPVKAAEQEAVLNIERAKAYIKTNGQLEVERERGRQNRDTEHVRGDYTLKAADKRGEATLAAIEARNTGAVDVQETRNQGTLAAAEARGRTAENVAKIRVNGSMSVAQLRKGGGGSGGGGGSAGGTAKVQSRMTDENGNVILVMRDGTHKALVNDDGRPVKSLDYQKLIGSTAAAIGKTEFGNTYQQNRDAAKKTLGDAAPAPAAGGKDYRNLWSK